jgi:O-succinylbenzoic acid--CoA ligase
MMIFQLILAPGSASSPGNQTRYDFVAMVPIQAQNSTAVIMLKKMIVGGAK